jgi:lipocalin
MFTTLLHTLFLFFTFCNAVPLQTVSELDVYKYIGHWKQVYEAPTNILFQGYGKCITADYDLLPNGNISVLNSQINMLGEFETISGYAYYTDLEEPGKLNVHLDGVPVDSPYWVVKLGDVYDNMYDYAIITTPSGVSLWVLTRDIERFYELYNDEVLNYLSSYGFRYIDVDNDDCEMDWEIDLETNRQSECQIVNYLKNAGFPSYSYGTMVCISKYESSFDCDATNRNTDGSTDYGLFQINSYWWCSGDAKSKYNSCNTSCTSLFNCQTNANCAYTVWRQQGYNAWYGYQYHKTECDNYKVYC